MKTSPGILALLAFLTACSGSSPGRIAETGTPTLKVAFFEDGSMPGAQAHVAPAYQGVRLAVQLASTNLRLPALVELDVFDDAGDVATALSDAKEVVTDPSFVAAVAGPFWDEPPAVADALSSAGIPTLSLSMLGPSEGPGWFRMVATLGAEARAIVSTVDRDTSAVCMFGDGSPYSNRLSADIAAGLGELLRFRAAITDPTQMPQIAVNGRSKGCGAVVWTGLGTGGALLKLALAQANLGSLPFITGDGTKDSAFTSTAEAAGNGTIALCPCVDLSTSTDMRAQRLIHDFQSSFGVAPGPFAVEGYDVGRSIVSAISSGASDRRAMLQTISSRFPFRGFAGTYAIGPNGELQPSSVRVRAYVDKGMRWLPEKD